MTSHAHRLRQATALALALGAVVPSAACARVALDPPASQATRANMYVPPTAAFTDTVAGGARAPEVQVIRAPNGGGFDWGDAGIGAAGGVGIAMLGVAGALAITGVRRSDRPVQPRWSRPDRGLS
jgi:hypothetical protein